MKLSILGDEEITKIEVACTYPDYSSGNQGVYVHLGDFATMLLEAQAKATAKQILEWGDPICSDLSHGDYCRVYTQQRCPHCWQELEEAVR